MADADENSICCSRFDGEAMIIGRGSGGDENLRRENGPEAS